MEKLDGLYDSLLIDEYKKSISLPDTKLGCDIQLESKATKEENTIMDENEWKKGMNVRALYSEDGEYYEAIIKEIYDKDHILVHYYGYDNEEIVNSNDLKSSEGSYFISKQIRIAEEAKLDEDDNEDLPLVIRVGMPCRGLYDKNGIIYEATVLKIDEENQSALLIMSGFGVLFKAKFENIYESMPDCRLNQEAVARNYANNHQSTSTNITSPIKSGDKNAKIGDQGIIPPKISDNETIIFDSERGKSLHQVIHDNGTLNAENIQQSNEKHIEDDSVPLNSFRDMMKPETETEALACLVSSNYLSGYYAGYYDSMIQFRKRKENA